MLERTRNIKWGYLVIGILLAVIGVCFILFNNSLKALAISVGVILAVFATVFGVLTIASRGRGLAFAGKIIFAIICLVSGIVTAVFNTGSIDILISLFCLLLIVDGSFKLNTAAMSKRYSVGGWWIMMTASVLVILSAFALAKYTPSQEKATILLGIVIVTDALANIFSMFWVPKYETAEKAEIYYAAHKEFEDSSNLRP